MICVCWASLSHQWALRDDHFERLHHSSSCRAPVWRMEPGEHVAWHAGVQQRNRDAVQLTTCQDVLLYVSLLQTKAGGSDAVRLATQ